MKTFVKTVIAMTAIIILGLALVQNTEAAPKYAKNVSDFNYNHAYVLEAADFPKSSTTKIGGRVAAPNASGWMDLIKYDPNTAESKHAVWYIDNHEQQLIDGIFYPVTAPTYSIFNTDPLPYWSNSFMGRAITYTSKGFYRQEMIYGHFDPYYEYFPSPAQRYTIKKVRTDAKTGRAVFRFINAKSKIAMAAGGYADFYVMIL